MQFNRNLRIVLYNSTEAKVLWRPFGYHKLLLAVFGLLLDGMRGFWAGFIIGCIFDAEYIEKEKPKKNTDWRISYLMLGAFVLQSPGVGSKISGSVIRNVLVAQFGEIYTQQRLQFFYELLRQRIQLEKICDHMRKDASPQEKTTLLRFLFELAEQPGVHTENLHRNINYIAARIDIPFEEIQKVYQQFKTDHRNTNQRTQNNANATRRENTTTAEEKLFALFNLKPTASEKEVKRAYYTLAKQYHPDSNPQAGPQQKKNLESQLRIVIESYEQICAMRGWK